MQRVFLGLCWFVFCLGCSKSPTTVDLTLPVEIPTPDRMTLYSIEFQPQRKAEESPQELFHRHPVLGKIDISEPAMRRQLFGPVHRGAIRGGSKIHPMCWEPRHGVRVTNGSVSEDYLLCFECHQMTREPNPNPMETMFLHPDARAVFNKVLEDAGIPLAK